MTAVGDPRPPFARPGLGDALGRAVVRRLVRRVPLSLSENGRLIESGPAPTVAAVNVREPAAYRAVALGGSVELGRTFAAGWWEADDLVGLLRFLTRRLVRPPTRLDRLASLTSARGGRRLPQRVDKDRDRRNVRAHYDLSDEFFALFLDPTLTYSCALFERPGITLEEAQTAKLERICQLAELDPSDSVLEIGTGWGSFALHAAGRHGCSVTTTTVSEHQLVHARRRVKEADLGSLVSVHDLDYRDLEGTYDKVVSIEMIEAIGWRQVDTFFQACARLLRPGGLLALQAIVIDDRFYERAKHRDDFIKAVVFPGSCLPSVSSLVAAAGRTNSLRLLECADIGQHYAETLARWRSRFHQNRREIEALGFDETFLRLWDFYLAYCEAGFAERRISDVQLLFEAPGGHRRRGAPV
jgi:cyclopropane-fatty-acyl-phospholipid synthase